MDTHIIHSGRGLRHFFLSTLRSSIFTHHPCGLPYQRRWRRPLPTGLSDSTSNRHKDTRNCRRATYHRPILPDTRQHHSRTGINLLRQCPEGICMPQKSRKPMPYGQLRHRSCFSIQRHGNTQHQHRARLPGCIEILLQRDRCSQARRG